MKVALLSHILPIPCRAALCGRLSEVIPRALLKTEPDAKTPALAGASDLLRLRRRVCRRCIICRLLSVLRKETVARAYGI